ncbi:hypothetical protein Hte_008196 [Hypoxylon texense]
MLRRLWQQSWAGPRGSTAASSVFPKTRSSFGSTWPARQSRQSSFFTHNTHNITHKVAFPRHGPRTRHPGQQQGRRRYHHYHHHVLRAGPSGIYGTIFMSIVLLVTDPTMDWQARQEAALATVYGIMYEPDEAVKIGRFWRTGLELLGAYAGIAAAEIRVYDPRRQLGSTSSSSSALGALPGWPDDELAWVVCTAPDPEWPGGTLVLCQAVLFDPPDPDAVYVAEHGNRATDASEALLVKVEEFARGLGGPVRGGILLMQPNGDWKSVYFDGKRWINVVYLEWQTAASMGLE